MWAMATKSTGSAHTAPKGHATRARNADSAGRTLLTPMVQWILVILVGMAIVAAIFYFGSDLGSGGGGGNHSGLAPTDVASALVFMAT